MMEWIEKFRRIRGWQMILGVAVAGLLLLLLPGTDDGGESLEEDGDISSYAGQIEHKIAQMADALAGVSDARVLVTLEETTVQNTGFSTVSTVQTPRVKGIAVVCSGGDDPDVQLAIISMLAAAYDLPSSRIYVGAGIRRSTAQSPE